MVKWHELLDEEGRPHSFYCEGHVAMTPEFRSEALGACLDFLIDLARDVHEANDDEALAFADTALGAKGEPEHFYLRIDPNHDPDEAIFCHALPNEPGAFPVTGFQF